MTLDTILKTIAAVAVPAITLFGLLSRKHRLRNDIRENLDILEKMGKHANLSTRTPVAIWMQGRVALDVAKLSGQQLGTRKKPIPRSAAIMATVIGLGFGTWTYFLVDDGFVWYSVFPGVIAALMGISLLGMFTNRDLPPERDPALPEGATPLVPGSEDELLARLDSPEIDADVRFEVGPQADAALKFFRAMREGQVEHGIRLADSNWLLCRVQSWVWNNRSVFGDDSAKLSALANSMAQNRTPTDEWANFLRSEKDQFVEAWGELDPDNMGFAGRRRRIGRDYDLVIFAPVGSTGGYIVNGPTSVPGAHTFVMHHEGDWRVASHVGVAPPLPGLPPAWWSTTDSALDGLPD